MSSLEIFVNNRPENQSVDFYIKEDDAFAFGLTIAKPSVGEMPPVAFSISDTEAQALVDRLYTCGFRPKESRGNMAVLTTLKAHLEDMRKLVFETLPVA